MTTTTIAVNENNDIFANNDGNIPMRTGILAVLQSCAQAAKTQLGEMVLAINQGIPNFQAVWIGVPNIALFEAYLRANILAVNGVLDIVNLTTNVLNNVLKYNITILTEFGKVALSSTTGGSLSGVLLDEDGNVLLLEDGSPILLE